MFMSMFIPAGTWSLLRLLVLLTAAVGAQAAATSTTTTVPSSFPNKKQQRSDEPGESNITWTGIVDSSGVARTFTGPSLEAIELQIRETHPNYNIISSSSPSPLSSSPAILPKSAARATPTDPVKNTNILCEAPALTTYASVFHIKQGVSYLRHIKGNCSAGGPGPGNCGRVSCSYNSGIWFCNDNPFDDVSVPCSALGDKAEDILVKCLVF